MLRISTPRLWTIIFPTILILVACNASTSRGGTPTALKTAPAIVVATSTASSVAARTPTVASATPTRTIQVTASALKGQQIVFWHPFTGARRDLLKKMIAEFNALNTWGIQVQVQAWKDWAELDEQIRQLPITKKQPDMLVGYNDQVLRWDSGGYLVADLNAYVSDPLWGLTVQEQESYYPAIWAQDYVPDGLLAGKPAQGGKRLGLPWYRSASVFYYNATWGRELGLTAAPRSAGEILSQACVAAVSNRKDTDRTNDGTGGWLVTTDPGILASWVIAFGGEIARPDRKGYQFDTPQARKAVESLYQAYTSGCVWKDPEGDPYQDFAQRRALLLVDSLIAADEIQVALERAGAHDNWLVLPFFSPTGEPIMTVSGPALIVLQTTPERQLAAWLFSRWLAAPENQDRWARGTGFLPVSTSAVKLMQEKPDPLSPVQQALVFLPYAHPEPVYASWTMLRWALVEALDRLLVPGLSNQQMAAILDNLDRLATEIHSQAR